MGGRTIELKGRREEEGLLGGEEKIEGKKK